MVPAEGSVVDLLVRAKNKETGEPLKTHQIVAQVGGESLQDRHLMQHAQS